MSDKCPKLKLRRKKCSVQANKREQSGENFINDKFPNRRASWENGTLAESHKSAAPDSHTKAWWRSPGPRETEQLWALVLKSAVIAHLEQDVCERIPDLPMASPASPSNEEHDRWRWCCLTEEVAPFPPALRSVASASSTHDHSVGCMAHSRPVLTEDGASLRQQRGHAQKTASLDPSPRPEGAREEAAGIHSFRSEDEIEQGDVLAQPSSLWGGLQSERPGAGILRSHKENVASAAAAPSQRQSSVTAAEGCPPAGPDVCATVAVEGPGWDTPPAGWPYEPADGTTGGGPSEASDLASCPMCLMPFPAGVTQMDCDSHLAKCLSEMSEDVVW